MLIDSLAIVGIGLVGGSIVLATREQRVARRIIGVARRPETLSYASQTGMIDEGYHEISAIPTDVNLAIVCTPVKQIAHLALQCLALSPQIIVSDVGSTKAQIVDRVESDVIGPVRFMGGHPLAGSEKTGPEHARADLFVNRWTFLTPTPRSSPNALELLADFWKRLGAQVQTMTAREHDRIMAKTSHLSHLLAFALAGSLEPADAPFVGSGFRDTTRLAGSDPGLWAEIALSNRDFLLAALDQMQTKTTALRKALDDRNEEALIALFAHGRKVRHALGS